MLSGNGRGSFRDRQCVACFNLLFAYWFYFKWWIVLLCAIATQRAYEKHHAKSKRMLNFHCAIHHEASFSVGKVTDELFALRVNQKATPFI